MHIDVNIIHIYIYIVKCTKCHGFATARTRSSRPQGFEPLWPAGCTMLIHLPGVENRHVLS